VKVKKLFKATKGKTPTRVNTIAEKRRSSKLIRGTATNTASLSSKGEPDKGKDDTK